MKRAFTLLELLVVVAIMGLLGTISVGGYRQMQRGMEERSALETASRFIRMAYQRAQIDRKPTAVYFWNETMREADSEGYENEIVVGKAVAVRQHGRISGLNGGDGLVDEFADLNYTYSTNATGTAGSGAGNTFRLYNFDNPQELKYSVVSAVIESNCPPSHTSSSERYDEREGGQLGSHPAVDVQEAFGRRRDVEDR